MSGVVKSVAKVFKKVAKVVKKVAPFVLAAGAIYFTAAGALGAAGGWGGWATASTNAATSLFGPGLLADTVGGAITQAGYGALIGGATSAVMGKDISKGMQMGALGGAITGGVTGAWQSPYTFANPSTLPSGSSAAGGVNPTVPYNTNDPIIGGNGGDSLGYTKIPVVSSLPISAPVATGAPVVRPGLLGFWDEVKNSELASGLVGGVVKGIGEGLLAGDPSTDYTDAAKAKIAADVAAKRAAYIGTGGTGGLLTESTRTASLAPTPGNKWGYGYDPATGKLTGV